MSEFDLQHSVPTGGETIPCGALSSWEIENTDTANSMYVNERAAVPVASSAGGSEVPAGSTRTFFFDPKENHLIGLRAVTGAVLCNIRKETFRSRLLWNVARYASIRVQQADQFLQRVSATVVKLRGAFTEFRADTVDAKTAASGLQIGSAATIAAGGVAIGAPSLTGTQVKVGANNTYNLQCGATSFGFLQANVYGLNLTATEVQARNAFPVVQYNGQGTDPRHTLNSTERVLHTPVAGGAIDSTQDGIELPIDNGVVIAGLDLVMISSTTGRVLPATVANVTMPVLGYAIAGGTGNAGGTVFARVGFFGLQYGILADVAGVVGGQFVKPGTSTANQVESQTTPSLITFGRALITRANGQATEIALRGMG